MRLRSLISLARIFAPALTVAAIAFASISANADTFSLSPITVDTSTISGQSGYFYFTFGADGTGSTPVNSTVSVSSPSFSPFTLDNSGMSNAELEPLTFGSTFTFTPTFVPTATPGVDSGNLFTVYALDSSYNPYPTADPMGADAVVFVTQSSNGSVSTPAVYNPVPEVSTFVGFSLMALFGVFALILRRYRTA